ncbi:putative transcriptional response regulator [Candidatus Termititenax persephonae]|uniref:Transcriptional response regulator n=1 Tax=Candidatus Termititenax persephonae TaxID=2218525 RepID=A0A388THP5_9BACT|nr:putative transcriptional response regulator [Candidatus Termititenax persephonae]
MPLRIIGKSPALYGLFQQLKAVMDSDVPVLLEGESGTGKELAARILHYQGGRKDKPFVAVNCAALPETLIEAELFGYEKGAFTGADRSKPGKFEVAHQGTIFLDEIGEMPLELQAKLLRVLQSGQMSRLGSNEIIEIDARIISATNRKLINEVAAHRFREDLYYRLAVFPITVPPLRERGQDIILLAEYFLREENLRGKKQARGFSEQAKASMLHYSWPGNIRELANVVKRAYLICPTEIIEHTDLLFGNLLPSSDPAQHPPSEAAPPPNAQPAAPALGGASLKTLKEIERETISERLQYFHGNVSRAAKSLGLTRATVYNKLR